MVTPMDINDRIAQWEKMAAEAPDGMSLLSLGNAYKDAERFDDAATAFRQALEHDAGLSRAYQALAQSLMNLSKDDEAGEVLTTGYAIAAERGDVMPQRAMGSLLQKLGLPLPEVAAPEAPEAELTGEQIVDRRTGKPGSKMTEPPFSGPLGVYIQAHFSQETWREWIGQGTKVINEFRLDFSQDEHKKTYDQQMVEWLGIDLQDVGS